MSQPKETCFFSHNRPYARGIDWYRTKFPHQERKYWGESSVDYGVPTMFTQVIPRIKSDLSPDIKFIFVARNPIERLESEWKMHYPVGWYGTKPFDRVLWEDGLVETSMYMRQIAMYIDAFGKESLCVQFFEDFLVQPQQVIFDCLDFLGASRDGFEQGFQVSHKLDSQKRLRHRHPWIARIAKSDFMSAFWNRVPAKYQKRLRGILKTQNPLTVPWTPELKRQVVEQLRDDSRSFLTQFGKPIDFWPGF